MNVHGCDHVGIVVESFDGLRELFGERLGLPVSGPDLEAELGIEVLWVTLGAVALELIRPLDPDGAAAEELRAGRGGVHHVAAAVADLDGALAELRSAGVPLHDAAPRRGVHGTRIAFLERAAAGGALLELVERAA